MENLNYREILVKKPFFELTPQGYRDHGMWSNEVSDTATPTMPEDTMYRNIKTQADFLREFYPSSHRIYDPREYPDIWKKTRTRENGINNRFLAHHLLFSKSSR